MKRSRGYIIVIAMDYGLQGSIVLTVLQDMDCAQGLHMDLILRSVAACSFGSCRHSRSQAPGMGVALAPFPSTN